MWCLPEALAEPRLCAQTAWSRTPCLGRRPRAVQGEFAMQLAGSDGANDLIKVRTDLVMSLLVHGLDVQGRDGVGAGNRLHAAAPSDGPFSVTVQGVPTPVVLKKMVLWHAFQIWREVSYVCALVRSSEGIEPVILSMFVRA